MLAFIPILVYAIKEAKKSTATYDRKGDIPVIIGVFLVFLLIGNLFVFAGNVKAVDKQFASIVLPVERLSSGGNAKSPRRFYVEVEYEGEELSLAVSRAEYLQLKVGDEVVMEIHRGNFGVYYYTYAGQARSSALPD